MFVVATTIDFLFLKSVVSLMELAVVCCIVDNCKISLKFFLHEKNRKEEGRIPESSRSRQSYLLTYFRLRTEKPQITGDLVSVLAVPHRG